MSDALGIIGFYFAIISFISGIFINHINEWSTSVKACESKVKTITERAVAEQLSLEEVALRGSVPWVVFVVVGCFISFLGVLGFFVPFTITPGSPSPQLFLYTPIFVTLAIYWLGGIVMICQGKRRLNRARPPIDKLIRGGVVGKRK